MDWQVEPRYRDAWSQWATRTNFDASFVQSGSVVDRNRRREVRRIEVPSGPVLFLKCFHGPGARRRLGRELENCREFASRGLNGPPLVAWRMDGAHGQLLVEEIGTEDVDHRLLCSFANGRTRRAFVRALGAFIGELHEGGLRHGQLFAWHLRVREAGGGWDFAALDVGEVRWARGPVSGRGRRRDLGQLFATLSAEALSRRERCALLAGYGLDRPARRRWWGALLAESLRAHRRGRQPRRSAVGREWRQGKDRVWICESLASQLEDDALPAARWLQPPRAVVQRERDGRKNLRLDPAADGGVWFGKAFRPSRRKIAPGVRELRSLETARWLGFAVPEVVLIARQRRGFSCFWTRGVLPGTSLFDMAATLSRAERRAVTEWTARWVRQLHGHGFVHRDLYLDHFLLDDASASGLCWIDWGRLRWCRRLSERRRAKELGALEFSARRAGLSRSARLRWLLHYAVDWPRRSSRSEATRQARRHWQKRCRRACARADRLEWRVQKRTAP